MPLQLRRGNTAEVGSTLLAVGELVYDTQLKRVSIGDGSTTGGVPIAGVTTNEAKDAAAASLLAGTHQNVSFTYNSVTKALSARVDIISHDTVEADAVVTSRIFNTASTLVIDVDNSTITGNITGIVTGTSGSTLVGNVTGNTTGYHTGDVKGSVFADDSSIIVDAVDNILNIPTITSTGSLVIRPNGTTSLQSSVIVGSASNNINGNLHIVRNVHSNNFDSSLHITNSHNTDIVDPFYFRRTRGTPTVYTAVQTNDQLGRISFLGWDGTQFLESAGLRAVVTNVSAGIVESSLILATQDSTGAFITPLRLSNTGRLQLGTQGDTHNGMIDIVSNYRIGPSNDAGQPIVIRQFFNDQLSNSFGVQRARGTGNSPVPVQNSDGLFQIQITGYDGAIYQRAAAINFLVDGPVSSGVVPGLMQFRTAGLDGQILVRATIDSSGKLNAMYGITGDLVGSVFADDSTRIVDSTDGGRITTPSVTLSNFLQLPVYANDTARSTAISSPQQGMVVFMQSGTVPTVTNKPVIYNGSAWEAF